MKEAFEKLRALAESFHESTLELTGGYYLIVASSEANSETCLSSAHGAPQDLIEGIVNFMASDPANAALIKTAAIIYDSYVRYELNEEEIVKETISKERKLS